MKIQFLSDVHENHEVWDDFKPIGDVIVAAGDMGQHYVQPVLDSELPWLWVSGNHEYYSLNDIGVYVRTLENRITDIDGQVFIGCTLWTDSQRTKLLNDIKFVDFDIICKWHQKQVAWLWDMVEKKYTKDSIIITHHAPSFKSVPTQDYLTSAFCNNLDQLVRESEAKLWIHGHTHFSCDYTIGKTRVVSNQVGHKREDTGYEKNKIIEV